MRGAHRDLAFAIPGDIAALSGGYGYDRRMIAELGRLGWRVSVVPLPEDFPLPDEAALRDSAAAFAAIPDGALVLVDGLAFGALPELAAREAKRLRLVALVHHPLALEDDLAADVSARLHASEQAALAHARAVIATSRFTAALLVEAFNVRAAVTVAPPGTERVSNVRPRTEAASAPLILCVAAVIPRKDHALLVDALARLADRPWRCRIVGNLLAHPDTTEALRRQIAEAGLASRIGLVGAVADIEREYAAADIFALPSRFEGYGMAFAEAMAHGLAIVGCAGGAVQDVVPPEAGRLAAPGDLEAFTSMLGDLIDDPALRVRLSEGALRHAQTLPSWEASARILSEALGAAL